MSLDFWRENNFRLEPWSTDYQPPIEIQELSSSESEVNHGVEETNWSDFISQKRVSPELPQKLVFIDGRRRMDAALVGGAGNTINYGVFGTIAVGAVVVDRSKHTAKCDRITIHRILGFGGNQKAPEETFIPCPLGSKTELVYLPVKPHLDNKPEIRRKLVQTEMLKAETILVESFAPEQNTLIVRDGPLSYNSSPLTLGYVKTMHKNYLDSKHATLLWELKSGERTPIFGIQDKNQPLWSWYLKSGNSQISSSKLGYHDLHGIVRLELSSEVDLEEAKLIADQTTYLIPEYSSHLYKDSRAPQNLTPVGALERELGRRMGDPNLIKRRLQHFLGSIGVVL
ncbi:MAG: hypothetical protein QNJ49_17510 [Mastigocoleus sp. MO_167.B18]|nr:hypothetical protein [Mastigocoleus sp. MO_167.B18]